ncbi:PREDICTED: trihelix transcription factor ASR3-like [Camelina sativa]|uniref:Trihelix transcription factor ASR3-like n=1 Tax=Camelina sativa TaxID=90675 RepID=A0ABM0YED0_CAMSA|nr:PREDICTED: trihelix transcription factor ASR3-like [Camelina sativa]
MADQSGGLVMMREYRKGNWTLNETMVLIEAKKMDDERRMRRSIGLPPPEQQQDSRSSSNKPAELRWKWIEDYCWRKGCMRSQNQCNDKWDNLMRDYKKVREYERRRVESSFAAGESSSSSAAAAASAGDTASYWKMEKSERKERNLPSNMLPQTYQALFEVVENKTLSSSTAATAVAAAVAAAAAAIESGNGSGGGQLQQQGLGFVVPKVHQIIHQPPPLPPPPAVIVSLPPPPSQPPPPLQPLPRPLLLPPPPPPSFHAQPILPTVGTFFLSLLNF